LAGPVVAAAVILPRNVEIEGADDSKKLTPKRRSLLSGEIRQRCLAWAVGSASPRYIEKHNIAVATFHAMRVAVGRLAVRPARALADGWAIPGLSIPCEGIIGGDGRSLSIACASILAKVYRDRLMERMAGRYPGYGLEKHKGYGTAEHVAALRRLGPSPIHRLTFAPVSEFAAAAQ
jgi:ribonuclease HII